MITLQTIQGTDAISSSRLTINNNFSILKEWVNLIDSNTRLSAI